MISDTRPPALSCDTSNRNLKQHSPISDKQEDKEVDQLVQEIPSLSQDPS